LDLSGNVNRRGGNTIDSSRRSSLIRVFAAGQAAMIEEFDDVVAPIVAVHPPQQWLYTACGLVAAALIMALFGPLWMAILGYLLASFGAVGLVAKFRWDDRLARRSPYYSPNQRLRSLQKILGAAIIFSCTVCVIPIAQELARR
jgi:hypothetical protein